MELQAQDGGQSESPLPTKVKQARDVQIKMVCGGVFGRCQPHILAAPNPQTLGLSCVPPQLGQGGEGAGFQGVRG